MNAIRGHGRRVYRSAGGLRGALLATLAVPVLVALAFVVKGALILGLVFAVLWAIAAWRFWQWGVRASPEDVRLGQFWVTRTFHWEEIDKFYGAPSSGKGFAAWLLLRDGRKFACLGISTVVPTEVARQKQVQGTVDELNALLAERRGTH